MLARTLVCFVALVSGAANAQTRELPRTPDGRPDFQGVWESLWLTPLERPANVPGDIPESDLARVRDLFKAREAGRAEYQLETEGEFAIAVEVLKVGGVYRGSQVIDPPNGRIPRSAASMTKKTDQPNADGPESYNRIVRCLSGVATGPMLFANFDMLHRIVQTPDDLVIYSEFIADTRIMPIGETLPEDWPRTMTGSSIARWDGDVLVVETSRFDGTKTIGFGPFAVPLGNQARVVERFRLNGPDELIVRYTVTDSENYTQPWSGEIAWVRTPQRLYETMCHEANYSLANMLRAARIEEQRAAAQEALKTLETQP